MGAFVMGYILPIQQYQYNDYQRRVTEVKQNPHFIDKPFKVILERQHQEIKHEYERINKTMYQKTSAAKPADEKLFAVLTGKGRSFSRSI